MALSNQATACLAIAFTLLLLALCANNSSEGFVTLHSGNKRDTPERAASKIGRHMAPLKKGFDGNMLYFGPVDANLLQVTSTGRTY